MGEPNFDGKYHSSRAWYVTSVPADNSITGTSSTLAVTTASQLALAANANRKYASFQNDSDTVIYLKVGAAAVANEGIRLNPNGGSYEMSPAIGNLELTAVYAIHGGTGNKNLLIKEGV